MKYPININDLNDSVEFYLEVKSLLIESKKYLNKHHWCKTIYQGWLFTNIGFAVCIFLYEIENTQSPEDNLIWVIAGDFPPMYLDTYNVSSSKEVVATYIDLATDWIKHFEAGESLDNCYPFEVNTNLDLVQLFKKKIVQLSETILPNINDINYKSYIS